MSKKTSLQLSRELVRLVFHVCPECKKLIGLAVPSADGRLGSPIYCCKHCQGETYSDQTEWARFDRQRRKAFFNRSIVLALLIGAALTVMILWALVLTGKMPTQRPIAYLIIAFLLTAGSTAGVQGLRVFTSLQRDADGDLRASDISFFSFESNIIVRLMLPITVAALVFGIAFIR